jgi:hypothetical protein
MLLRDIGLLDLVDEFVLAGMLDNRICLLLPRDFYIVLISLRIRFAQQRKP